MELSHAGKVIKLAVICILAALMNILFTAFLRDFLEFPLYIDTVFNVAVTFAAGLVPGVAVAVLSWLIPAIYWRSINFYVLCSITEVILVCALIPAAGIRQGSNKNSESSTPDISQYVPKEKIITTYTSLAAKLIFLYIVCAVTISVLGGIINYVSDLFPEMRLAVYSVEDTFKLGLVMDNLPVLAVNILSRIQVNIVDRFIVIFGGYFISRGLVRIIR